MTGKDTQKVDLTPGQRRQLGQVYRLILNWRRERKNKADKPFQHEAEQDNAQPIKPNSDTVGAIESEA